MDGSGAAVTSAAALKRARATENIVPAGDLLCRCTSHAESELILFKQFVQEAYKSVCVPNNNSHAAETLTFLKFNFSSTQKKASIDVRLSALLPWQHNSSKHCNVIAMRK
jgi:hypothetical protein